MKRNSKNYLVSFMYLSFLLFSCGSAGKVSFQRPDLDTEIRQMVKNMIPEFIEIVRLNELRMENTEEIHGSFAINDSGRILKCRVFSNENWSSYLASALNDKKVKGIEPDIILLVKFTLKKTESSEYTVEKYTLEKRSERDKIEVLKGVQGYLSELQYLYNKRIEQKPEMNGKVTAIFYIDESGNISKAGIQSSKTNDSVFDSTIIEKVKTWKFQGSGEIPYDTMEVIYPFVFTH